MTGISRLRAELRRTAAREGTADGDSSPADRDRDARLGSQLIDAAARAREAQALFDTLPLPAAVITDRFEVRWGNRHWRTERAGRALAAGPAGEASDGRRVLASAIRGGARTFLPMSVTGLPGPLLVVPLVKDIFATSTSALVVLGGRRRVPADFASAAGRLFGLTRAEAAVAAMALGNQSLRQVAAARGTTIGTVRSQMKSILMKTGAGTKARATSILLQSL